MNVILENVWPEWHIEGPAVGRGSFGTVYKAVKRDHGVESFAAVKVISIPQDESEFDSLRAEGLSTEKSQTAVKNIVDSFVNEIRMMESFKGVQNIVSVEDYKVVEKQDGVGCDIYIRMELLTPFVRRLADHSMTEAEVVRLGTDICTALELLEKKNVIHRDIKPQNITYGSSVSNIDMESMLGSMTTIPSIAFPVYAYHEEGSRPWYGVSSTYSRNPIGDLEACGYYLEQTRSGAANIALDYDFKEFVPGLRFKTFLTFNSLNMTRIGKDNDYMAYIVSPPAAGSEDPVLIKVRDGVDNADQSKLKDYYYQRVALHEKLSYDAVFGDHALQAALVYSLSNGLKVSRREPERQQNGILSVLYSFKDRYSFEGVMNYAGTASFEVGKRYRLFPAAGIGWVVSEEPFMKDRLPFVNFLKLYANAGILGYDGLATAFYYQDRWSTASASSFGPHTANQWFGSNTESVSKTYPNRIANSNLTWEERREMALGMDALLFGERVSFGLNLYNNVQDGVIAKMSYMLPYLTGYSSASPWVNYDIYRYRGLEMKLAYSNQINHFKYSVGGNVSFYKSEVLKYDEPNYRESYRSKIGKSKNAIPGYTYIGRYASDEEAMSVTQFFDSNLAAGDLKYQDLNNDGIIDANDISFIGNSYPKIIYGVNVNLAYRNLGLKIIGAGRACFDLQKSNIYFRNGTGDNNYSKYVLENIGEGYPRLTYNRVANNFQTSAFWLERGDFFKIQNVELSYKLPLSKAKGIQGMKFLLRGANLLTISGVKDVDPESVDSGVTRYPLFRTFTGGMEISF